MGTPNATKTVTVVNPQGLHARPANMFVQLANTFVSTIEVVKDGERVDGKSILGILTLAAEKGSQLALEATGEDANNAIEALVKLVEQGFSEVDTPGFAESESINEQ
jgi:phosphocarrier protein HPr